MLDFLALFAFTVSGLVGVLLIVWWWADGRDDAGGADSAPAPHSPSDSVRR